MTMIGNQKINLKNEKGEKTGCWVEAINEDSDKAVRIAEYKDGLKEGKAMIIYSDDGDYDFLKYKKDKLEGIYKHFLNDGTLCYELIYNKDTIVGEKIYCEPHW